MGSIPVGRVFKRPEFNHMTYSDAELEKLLSDTESDLTERKESWKGDAPEEARQAICAFANDLPNHRVSGVLFVGSKNDGTPSRIRVDEQMLTTLGDIKTDGNILPPPSIVVEKRRLKGDDVAVITVQPADAPPVRYKGRVWIRIGPRRGIATAQDERILNEKRRGRDLPFDIQPIPSCSLSELSRTVFEQEYLPRAFAPDVLATNERTYEERLTACRMVHPGNEVVPTVLGILVLGKSPRDILPGAYVQFLRIDGAALSDPIRDEAVLDGSLSQVIQRLDDKLDAHNTVAVDIRSGSIERRSSDYPRVALQQLTRNALMHRTYENTNNPVRVYWFKDRVEIHNSGNPFGVVTAQNFGKPGITDYRNPHLADAMKVLGFVQRFGVGIQTANAELGKNGNPPVKFDIQPTTILATVRRRS